MRKLMCVGDKCFSSGSGTPPPSPQPAVIAAPRHHVRCQGGRHKRQTVAGHRAELSHRARRLPGVLRSASSPSFPFAEGPGEGGPRVTGPFEMLRPWGGVPLREAEGRGLAWMWVPGWGSPSERLGSWPGESPS